MKSRIFLGNDAGDILQLTAYHHHHLKQLEKQNIACAFSIGDAFRVNHGNH